ncbi:MAG TPA: ABC transporter substrate-binding protein, partial [Phycisphaerales bacterium]|nr:ABC transporter substrate-binding protein [Phycisphaerales bacterium]
MNTWNIRLRNLGFLFAAGFLLSLVGCGNQGSNNATAKPGESGNSESGGAIKVGHYASLTGAEATFGVSTDNGIKLAVEERNAAGGVKGRKIELITYDNQGKAQESITTVTRLIQQDHVAAVLGEVASSRSLAGGPVCQKYSVPMITPS